MDRRSGRTRRYRTVILRTILRSRASYRVRWRFRFFRARFKFSHIRQEKSIFPLVRLREKKRNFHIRVCRCNTITPFVPNEMPIMDEPALLSFRRKIHVRRRVSRFSHERSSVEAERPMILRCRSELTSRCKSCNPVYKTRFNVYTNKFLP